MASLVRLICPNLRCRAMLSVPEAARGKKVKCRQCGTNISVPAVAIPAKPERTEPQDAAASDK